MGESSPGEAVLPRGSVPSAELELERGALVIADLHLAPLGDERSDGFVAWCDGLNGGVPQLICMGDLFDTWVGAKQARLPGSRRVLDGFRRLVDRGVEVHVIPGNRDALLDRVFEELSGARLHPEGFVGVLPSGERAVFVHGDSLCTLDRDYQRLRRVWRMGLVRAVSRYAPLLVARAVGKRLRARSERAKPFKLAEEKSIRPVAVAALAGAVGAGTVVCGHAHEVRDEGDGPRWIVVGAWGWEGDVFRVGGDGALGLAAATNQGPPSSWPRSRGEHGSTGSRNRRSGSGPSC